MGGGLHAAGAAGLKGAAGIIQPHIATAHHHSANLDVVVFNKHQVPLQLAVLGEVGDFLDEPFPVLIGGMGFAGENKLHGPLGILGEFYHFLKVIENQRGALVRGKAAGKADGQGLGVEPLERLFGLGRGRTLAAHLVAEVVAMLELMVLLEVLVVEQVQMVALVMEQAMMVVSVRLKDIEVAKAEVVLV